MAWCTPIVSNLFNISETFSKCIISLVSIQHIGPATSTLLALQRQPLLPSASLSG